MPKKDTKVKNEMTKVPATKEMNDRDYLNDLLASEKCVSKDMTIMLTEASNEDLYNVLKPLANKILDCQRTLFELAFNNGWYVLEEAEKTKIKEKHKELKKLNDEL